MHCELLIPGLLLPTDQRRAALGDIVPPALTTLLSRGHLAWHEPATVESRLATLAGPTPAPLAALRLLGEDGGNPGSGFWLCADPVQISITQQGLMLADAASLELTQQEANAVIASLNAEFADLGRFHAPAPDRWYLQAAAPSQPGSRRLDEVIGRRVDRFLPTGPDGRLWQRNFNEIQVFLHGHPVNQAREEKGQPQLNSVWFWGEGALPQKAPEAAFDAITADLPLARGLARLWNAPATPLQAGFHGSGQHQLVVADGLLRPALYTDLDGWQSALTSLDRDWLAPALAALKKSRLKTLRLFAPGDHGSLEITVEKSDLWKFWRKGADYLTLETPESGTGENA